MRLEKLMYRYENGLLVNDQDFTVSLATGFLGYSFYPIVESFVIPIMYRNVKIL